MSSTLNNTVEREGTEHAVSSARSSLLDGLHAVSTVVGMLRNLHLDDALGRIGLARKSGPFSFAGPFGAGVIVGAGFGMLLAPQSGAVTRRAILRGWRGLAAGDESVVKKAIDTVKRAEAKVEKRVVEGADVVSEKVRSTVDSMKDVHHGSS